MENMGLGEMGNFPQLSHFSPVFLPLPTNFTQFFYISHNVRLAISHKSPFSSISPHFAIFPIFVHLCSWLIRLRLKPMPGQ